VRLLHTTTSRLLPKLDSTETEAMLQTAMRAIGQGMFEVRQSKSYNSEGRGIVTRSPRLSVVGNQPCAAG